MVCPCSHCLSVVIALTPCRLSCRVQFDLQSPARHSVDRNALGPKVCGSRCVRERMPQGPLPGHPTLCVRRSARKRIPHESYFVAGFCRTRVARVVVLITSEIVVSTCARAGGNDPQREKEDCCSGGGTVDTQTRAHEGPAPSSGGTVCHTTTSTPSPRAARGTRHPIVHTCGARHCAWRNRGTREVFLKD